MSLVSETEKNSEQLLKKLTKKREVIKRLKIEKNEMMKENEELSSDNSLIAESNERLGDEIDKLEEENAILKKSLQRKQKRIYNLEFPINNYKKNISEKEDTDAQEPFFEMRLEEACSKCKGKAKDEDQLFFCQHCGCTIHISCTGKNPSDYPQFAYNVWYAMTCGLCGVPFSFEGKIANLNAACLCSIQKFNSQTGCECTPNQCAEIWEGQKDRNGIFKVRQYKGAESVTTLLGHKKSWHEKYLTRTKRNNTFFFLVKVEHPSKWISDLTVNPRRKKEN